MINKATLLITFLISSALLFSCTNTREIASDVRNHVRADLIHQRVAGNNFKFNDMSAKLSVKYTVGNETKAFKAILKTKKDSIIWLSIRFGILEVARLAILKDTLKLINRTESRYFIGSYDYLRNNYGLDINFDFVQSLISGNPYYFDARNKYRSAVDKGNYYLANVNKKKYVKLKENKQLTNLIVQAFWINANYRMVEQGLKFIGNESFSNVKYTNFEEVEGQQFAKDGELQIEVKTPINIKWHYTKISTDKPLTFSFTIPEKYEQVN
ncbi:MAG: DUF4292 domain-containing protein [Bacteroidetes bacterium]|nr:DUF4292 domain-containing protein [Bacteroidota bacterium]